MTILVLLACVTDCMDCYEPCPRSKVSTATTEPPVSEDEVWVALEGFAPAVVSWLDNSADATTSSPIRWTLTRASGDAETVEYTASDSCVARTGIAIPVQVEADVADGNAVQNWSTDLEGFGATLDQIELFDEGVLLDDVHATLSTSWAETCVAALEWGEPLDEAWITYNGTFADLKFNILGGLTTTDARKAGTCWSGVLGEVATDTGGDSG